MAKKEVKPAIGQAIDAEVTDAEVTEDAQELEELNTEDTDLTTEDTDLTTEEEVELEEEAELEEEDVVDPAKEALAAELLAERAERKALQEERVAKAMAEAKENKKPRRVYK